MNDLAKARDNWLRSREGAECQDGTASGEYLRNRLIAAFLAGWEANGARDAWQPIESAPDNTPVWVLLGNGAIITAERIYVESPDEDGWMWSRGIEPYVGSDGQWHFTDGDLDDWHPIAWHPLPKLPALAQEPNDAT